MWSPSARSSLTTTPGCVVACAELRDLWAEENGNADASEQPSTSAPSKVGPSPFRVVWRLDASRTLRFMLSVAFHASVGETCKPSPSMQVSGERASLGDQLCDRSAGELLCCYASLAFDFSLKSRHVLLPLVLSWAHFKMYQHRVRGYTAHILGAYRQYIFISLLLVHLAEAKTCGTTRAGAAAAAAVAEDIHSKGAQRAAKRQARTHAPSH